MGFSSIDDLVAELTGGKFWKSNWNKITGGSAYTANRWYDLTLLAGFPSANAYAGTALTAYQLTDASPGAMYHGGNVSADTKHIINMGAVTAVATGVPSVIKLVDMLMYYPGINMNSLAAQNMTNGVNLPRYVDGKGVMAFLVIQTASGAAAHNFTMSYTDTGDNAGNAPSSTLVCTASAIAGHLPISGSAAGNFGPFIPLAAGDIGIKSVESVTLSAASGSGTAALVLCKELCDIPLLTAGVQSERDLLYQLPSLPQVVDGAYLGMLLFAGAAVAGSSNFFGYVDLAWG